MARSRGQVQAKGKDKWLIRIYLGREESGKRKYASEVVKGTKKSAEAQLTKILREMDTNAFVAPQRMTVGEFLRTWVENHPVAGRTKANYRKRIDLYIKPDLGVTPLQKLSPGHVRVWVCGLATRLQPASVKSAHGTLRAALSDAVEWGLIARNPAQRAGLPKVPKREMSVLTGEQVNHLLEVTSADTYGPLWRLLLTTGMRPEEALALKWSDLQGRRVAIQRVLTQDEHGRKLIKAGAKTDGSVRSVVLPSTTEDALRAAQKAQVRRLGGLKEWMFYSRSDDGLPPHVVLIERLWHRALAKAGLPRVRLYDARHTHATELLTNRTQIKVVAERLGHSDPAMTLRVYSHVLPNVHEEVADQIDNWRKTG